MKSVVSRAIATLLVIFGATLVIVLFAGSRDNVPRGVLETGVESIYIEYMEHIQSDSILTTNPDDINSEMKLLMQQMRSLQKDLEKLK